MTNDWEVAGGNLLGNTIVRIHLRIMFAPAALGNIYAVGLIIGRQSDVGLTGTALAPSNINARDLPWMLNTRFYANASAAVVDAQTTLDWDLRAQRVQKQLDERLLLSVSANALTLNYTPFARVLVKLP